MLTPPPLTHRRRRRPDGKWRRQRLGAGATAAAGWAAFGAGNLLRFASMRFGAQTVLSGLASLQFVVMPAAARQLLGVPPAPRAALGVAAVLAGNALIVGYGPREIAFSLPELRARWAARGVRAFVAALAAALAGGHLLWRALHARRRAAEAAVARSRRAGSRGSFSFDAAELNGNHLNSSLSTGPNGRLNTSAAAETPTSPYAAALDFDSDEVADPHGGRTFAAALLFSAVASAIGAWSVLFSKSLAYVVAAAPGSLADPYSWFAAAAFGGTAAYWVRRTDRGLRLYPAALIMPLMQAGWMAMSVLEGMVYFDEAAALAPPELAALLAGLALALAGAVQMGLAGHAAEAAGGGGGGGGEAGAPDSPGAIESARLLPPGALGAARGGQVELADASGRADGYTSPTYRGSPSHRASNGGAGGGAFMTSAASFDAALVAAAAAADGGGGAPRRGSQSPRAAVTML
jgi:hypothetical protein